MSFLKPSMALAVPNSLPDLPGWTGNITIALLLATMIEESTYCISCMIPGSQWANARIGALIAAVGAWGCYAGASVCHS